MKIFNWFAEAYAGKIALWKAFVFGYLLPLVPTTILTGIGVEMLAKGNGGVGYAIYVAVQLYYLWITIVLWRNSANASKPIYKLLARVISVITGIIAGGMLLTVVKS